MIDYSELVFADTETTGTDPHRHEVFEIALIYEESGESIEQSYWLAVDLRTADANALRINRYYERSREHFSLFGISSTTDRLANDAATTVREIASITSRKHLVGAVPSFDAAFLTALLRRHGLVPAWHYHLVDVEALMAGAARVQPPWKSSDLAKMFGVPDVPDEEKHTALADALWARDCYTAVMEGTP